MLPNAFSCSREVNSHACFVTLKETGYLLYFITLYVAHVYRYALFIGEFCYKSASECCHIIRCRLVVTICHRRYPLRNYKTLHSLSCSLAIDGQVVHHTTDIGSRVLARKHCVAGPPDPLEDILHNILCLDIIRYDASSQAIYRVA